MMAYRTIRPTQIRLRSATPVDALSHPHPSVTHPPLPPTRVGGRTVCRHYPRHTHTHFVVTHLDEPTTVRLLLLLPHKVRRRSHFVCCLWSWSHQRHVNVTRATDDTTHATGSRANALSDAHRNPSSGQRA